VRTLGLPGLVGALGACFGRVITMDSPRAHSEKDFSWQATLWHELAHVFTLQLSQYRVPRWLTEGISTYEEHRRRAAWGRELTLEWVHLLGKGKTFGVTRFGTLSDLASRIALRAHGVEPDRDVTMVQTGGPAEGLSAMAAGKVAASSLTPPGTLQARKLKFKLLFDMTKLDAEYHINGVLTTRRFLRSNEDTVRRFLRAYIEGAARAQKDKNFAFKVMGKYFRTDDKEILEESYDTTIRSNFAIPPHPSIAGVASLIQELEKQNPKAKGAKPEEFADGRLVREIEQSGFLKGLQ